MARLLDHRGYVLLCDGKRCTRLPLSWTTKLLASLPALTLVRPDGRPFTLKTKRCALIYYASACLFDYRALV
eukprot:554459-Pleurochrysis_carterae.AAC.2